MGAKEIYLQKDMFSGDLVDNRTSKQKKVAEKTAQAVQAAMFSQREMAQFGVKARPLIPLTSKTRIELALEDLRTEEEKERDAQREIRKHSTPLPGLEEPADTGF